jgi:hypothetical protein
MSAVCGRFPCGVRCRVSEVGRVTSCGWDELVRMSVEGGGWVAHARSLAATLTEIFARSKRGRPWYKLTAPMVLKGKRMGRRSRPRPHGGSILRRI